MTIDCYTSARTMLAALKDKQISARELMELHLEQTARTNPAINAIVSLDEDRARAGALAADESLARGEDLGALHGLPFAFKDTHQVGGWRSTSGSPLRENHVPDADELSVSRIRGAGAVTIGKTNVPEWAAGSHTFNPIFGTTVNPYDQTRSAGGSSGGAAAALASGMVPLADGSDMGGSLRNPASFCNVVGLRPSLGRVPQWPVANGWESNSVQGPMARSVGDLALLLSVMAGPSPLTPWARDTPGSVFAEPLAADAQSLEAQSLEAQSLAALAGLRVALSHDLDGAFEVEHSVTAVLEAQRGVLADAGATVTDASPDLHEAESAFRTLRAWGFQSTFGATLADDPAAFKDSLADNIRAGESLSGADIARAYADRTTLGERMRVFFTDHDVLVMPVSQVPPFSADEEYPLAINGRVQETYLDWMRSAYFITATGCPSISVPAGFTPEGWPVGIQIVAAPNQDRRLLEIAAAFEHVNPAGTRRPSL